MKIRMSPLVLVLVAAILLIAPSQARAMPRTDGGDLTLNGPAIYYYDNQGNRGYVRLHDKEDGFWTFAAFAMDNHEVSRLIPNEIRPLQNGGTEIVPGVFIGSTYYPPNTRVFTLIYEAGNKYRAPPGFFRIPEGLTKLIFWEPNGAPASNMGFGVYKIIDEGCFYGRLRIDCEGAPSEWFMIAVPGGQPWTKAW